MQTGWSKYLFNFGSPLRENGALHKHWLQRSFAHSQRATASAEITKQDLQKSDACTAVTRQKNLRRTEEVWHQKQDMQLEDMRECTFLSWKKKSYRKRGHPGRTSVRCSNMSPAFLVWVRLATVASHHSPLHFPLFPVTRYCHPSNQSKMPQKRPEKLLWQQLNRWPNITLSLFKVTLCNHVFLFDNSQQSVIC